MYSERNNVALLILCAVTAIAFPVLYSARAHEKNSHDVVYQLSAETVHVPTTGGDTTQEHDAINPETILPKQNSETKIQPVSEVLHEETTPVPPKEIAEPKAIEHPTIVIDQPEVSPKVHTVVVEEKEVLLDDSFSAVLISEIQRLTTQKRKRSGLSVLHDSTSLAGIALDHSTDMATQGYFSHTTPDGCTLTCRFENATYDASRLGENLATIEGETLPTAQELAETFFDQWMDSRGHRENLLSDEYTHQGIGVVVKNNTVYVTVNFAKPK